MSVIAIDFDHTIQDNNSPEPGRRMGPPFPDAADTIRQWYFRDRHEIIIHSCNRPKVIRDWLEYYDIPFHAIWGELSTHVGKPVADVYIDDRAVKFDGDWLHTERIVGYETTRQRGKA